MSDDAFLAITIRIERCRNSIYILALCIRFGYSHNAMHSKGGQMHCKVQNKSEGISNHKRKTKSSLSSFLYSLSCYASCLVPSSLSFVLITIPYALHTFPYAVACSRTHCRDAIYQHLFSPLLRIFLKYNVQRNKKN